MQFQLKPTLEARWSKVSPTSVLASRHCWFNYRYLSSKNTMVFWGPRATALCNIVIPVSLVELLKVKLCFSKIIFVTSTSGFWTAKWNIVLRSSVKSLGSNVGRLSMSICTFSTPSYQTYKQCALAIILLDLIFPNWIHGQWSFRQNQSYLMQLLCGMD